MIKLSVMLAMVIGSIFLFCSQVAYSATYYASNTNCSDSNPGTSTSPWCHCPGLSGWTGSATLSAGDTVYFDNSSTWTSSSNQVLDVTGGVTYIGNTWGTGTRAVFKATGTLAFGVIRITSDDPTYETVVQGFEVNANNQYADGIQINRSGWSVALTGASKIVQNCLVHNVLSNGTAGYYQYGIMISPQSATTGVSNVQILFNTVHDIGRGAIMLYPGPNNTYTLDNVLVRGNSTYNTGQEGAGLGQGCIIKNNVSNATIEFNNFYGDNATYGTAIQINNDVPSGSATGPIGLTIRYNILANTNGSNFYVQSQGVATTYQVDFYGNLVINAGLGYGAVITSSCIGSLAIRMYNNTFYGNWVEMDDYAATTTKMVFENNIIYAAAGTVPLRDAYSKITSHSNNLYYLAGGGTLVTSGSNNYTSSNLTTYEPTALSSNPLFTNISNLPTGSPPFTGFTGTYGVNMQPSENGLSLQAGSPGISYGINLGSPYNGSINTVTRPSTGGWDLGAYEVGVVNTVPNPPSNLSIRAD
jgi:hypothetical protein